MIQELTKATYRSDWANREYMSVSQYKDFRKCEAAALAKLNGEWSEGESDALLLGSYVHAHFEGTLELFKEEHPDLYATTGKNKGQLYAKFAIADKMIRALESDPFCMYVLEGKKEVIVTGEIGGVKWKGMIDALNRERGMFTDLKTSADLYKRFWHKEYEAWVSFVDAYDYPLQMAVYAELERQEAGRESYLEPVMAAVSKEDVPAIEVIGGFAERIDVELGLLKERLPRVVAVKEGREDPKRCDKCDYCRSTRKLDRIIHYADLID